MRRSEVVEALSVLLQEAYGPDSCAKIEADALLFFIEEIGMLPPVQSPSLIDDGKGGTKHGPAQRVWDKE